MKIHSKYLYLFGKSLFVSITIVFCSLSMIAQQPTPIPFQKPAWLNCYDKNRNYDTKEIEKRILYEYGAVYLSKVFEGRAADKKIPCLFGNEEKVSDFLKEFNKTENKLNFGKFYLQSQAKESLELVFRELGGYKNVARACNPTTTCNDSTNEDVNDDWSFRTYAQTLFNWCKSAKNPCQGMTEITCDSANKTCAGILDLKKTEELVSKKDGTDKPLMFSVAIPGGSQHHLGLAIDVNDGRMNKICGKKCVSVLKKHGWYRTIPFDNYHFTYLGFAESELFDKGLKKIICKEDSKSKVWFEFWVPDVKEDYAGYKFLEVKCDDVK